MTHLRHTSSKGKLLLTVVKIRDLPLTILHARPPLIDAASPVMADELLHGPSLLGPCEPTVCQLHFSLRWHALGATRVFGFYKWTVQ